MTEVIAILKGAEKKLFSRMVSPKGEQRRMADHVMGLDFAKSAFLMTAADDTGKRFTIAMYASFVDDALKEVWSAGFVDIQDVVEYAYL